MNIARLQPRRILRSAWLRLNKRLSKQIPQSTLTEKRLAVIAATHNRGGWRLENFLRTLSDQTLARGDYDLVIVDQGSDENHLAETQELCARYRVSLLRAPSTTGIFNKSLCNNIGLRSVGTSVEYALCTDVDMVFAETFLESVLRVSIQFDPAIVLCVLNRLPEVALNQTTDVFVEWPRLALLAEPAVGTGPCLAASMKWWRSVRGFDERIPYGGEDTDLHRRAVRSGLHEIWISDLTSFFHQWHESFTDSVARDGEKALKRWQEVLAHHHRLLLEDESIVRNPESWGETVGIPSRIAAL